MRVIIKLKQYYSVVKKYVDETLIENAVHEKSLLQKLLRVNRRYAMLMVFDMFVAGIDTTSISAQTLLYQLAMNPKKQARLQKEVFELLPNINSALSEDSLNNSSYLRACLKEALRMTPTVPTNMRSTGQDIVLNGYQVPKMVRL